MDEEELYRLRQAELQEEMLRRQRRAKRIEEMRQQKMRQQKMRSRMKYYVAAALVCIAAAFLSIFLHNVRRAVPVQEPETTLPVRQEEDFSETAQTATAPVFVSGPEEETETANRAEGSLFAGYQAEFPPDASYIADEEVNSTYAVLVDLDEGKVIAQRDAKTACNPASMTKILTLLVAAEHAVDLDDVFVMTREITDYAYVNDCSAAGFMVDEPVTVRDLMYGTILPSGGEAAAALAVYTAGSQEAFADMMNAKLEELGLSQTAHFTNCIGIYDENHYCTVYDMAMILKAALENDLCKEVLSAHIYTTAVTEAHPEGITLSNLFLRRIEDKEVPGEVVCAKTGFVNQSGNCSASYLVSGSGKNYICVTGNAYSSWRCIYDHVEIYQQYVR